MSTLYRVSLLVVACLRRWNKLVSFKTCLLFGTLDEAAFQKNIVLMKFHEPLFGSNQARIHGFVKLWFDGRKSASKVHEKCARSQRRTTFYQMHL
jgi:hypothetical protein